MAEKVSFVASGTTGFSTIVHFCTHLLKSGEKKAMDGFVKFLLETMDRIEAHMSIRERW